MKHTVIFASACLALGVAAAPAHAQSAVTLYGILDAGYLYTNYGNGGSVSEIADGIQSQSRFGVRGSEALGAGITAAFTLEGGIAIDTGQSQQAGRLFGRQAWAALQHRTGELRLGRQYGVGYEYFLANTSPFGTTFRDAGTGNVFSSAAGRLILDNVAMVRTGSFGGFSGAVGYSFNTNGTEVVPSGNNLSGWTGGLRYQSPTLYAAATYERFNCPDNATGTTFNGCNAVTHDDQQQFQVGGSFAFWLVRVYAMYAREEDQFTMVAVAPSRKADLYQAGVSAKLLGGEVLLSYQRRDDDFNADLDVWGLGYTYPLSRRTNLYAFVSDTAADSTPTTQLVAGGVIAREGYTPAQVTAYRDRDRTMIGVGLRHQF